MLCYVYVYVHVHVYCFLFMCMFHLLGLLGVVLAAPVLATLTFAGQYVARKMLSLEPWPEPEKDSDKIQYPWNKLVERLRDWFASFRERLKRK